MYSIRGLLGCDAVWYCRRLPLLLKREATRSSRIFVSCLIPTWHHKPENCDLNHHLLNSLNHKPGNRDLNHHLNSLNLCFVTTGLHLVPRSKN